MPARNAMNVMVVSDDLGVQQMLASALGRSNRAPLIASNVREAEAILDTGSIALVFCGDELPEGRIEDLIRRASRGQDRIPVVVVSRLDDWSRYLRFLHAGAFDYVLYPANGDEVDRVTRVVLFGGEVEEVKHAAAVA